MSKLINITISILFLSIFELKGQEPFSFKSKYLKYLVVSDSTSHSALLNADFNYLYTPKNGSLITRGTHWNVGINLARFFTRKIILGVSVDFKGVGGFYKQTFSEEFITDFNSNYIGSYDNEQDSLISNTFKGIVNGYKGYEIQGNTFSKVGIQFSPFPDRYGGIMIEIKKGTQYYKIGSPNTQLSTTDDGWIYLDLKNCYIINLKFNPYKFFSSKRVNFMDQTIKDFYKFFIVSLYYERLNLNGAVIRGKPLNEIVNQPFIDKYSHINSFGMKLGIGIY